MGVEELKKVVFIIVKMEKSGRLRSRTERNCGEVDRDLLVVE